VRIDTEPGGDTRPEVLDDDVRTGDQALNYVEPARRLQVDRNAALVPVVGQVVGAFTIDRRADDGPARIAAERLDLDDVRAEVTEELGGRGPGQEGRQIDDAQALQGRAFVGRHAASKM
jgi:hypothetical protein